MRARAPWGRHHPTHRRRATHRQLRRAGIAGVALVLGSVVMPVVARAVTTTPPASTAGLEIVFSAVDRATGRTGIYTVNADGSDLREVTPPGGARGYAFPSFAFGTRDIVYVSNAPGQQDSIYLMRSNGTDVERLTTNPWVDAQPRMSPNGRTIVFTSFWDEYPLVGLFALDVRTDLVAPLSGIEEPTGAVDSDPNWSATGNKLVFVNGRGAAGRAVPSEIWWMNSNGTGRHPIVADQYYNVDPALSPNGREVAFGSYRGKGDPAASSGALSTLKVRPSPWRLEVHAVHGTRSTLLTEGLACEKRPQSDPCTPAQTSAFQPTWTPDGLGVAFQAALSDRTQCICVVNTDGADARALFTTSSLAITWWSWARPSDARFPTPLSAVPTSRLLFGGTGPNGKPILAWSLPDRWVSHSAMPDDGLVPLSASFVPGHHEIVFMAKVPVPPEDYHETAPWPPGRVCHDHFVLSDLSNYLYPPVVRPADIPEYQVFVENTNGTDVRQLTTPFTMDCEDAIDPGDLRGNMDPTVSPNGRYVTVTNVSSLDDETFLLRIDLETGAVLNLTNATAGAMPTADALGTWSPNGRTIAFVSGADDSEEICTMGPTGYDFRQLTHDGYYNTSPSWSPNGRYLVYSSYRGSVPLPTVPRSQFAAEPGVPTRGWVLVKLDVATGRETILTRSFDGPAYNPVWSPDGSTIDFISAGRSGQPDIYTIPASGGTPRPLQVTLRTRETFLAWGSA
jgi:Tol biopolymer transport system component